MSFTGREFMIERLSEEQNKLITWSLVIMATFAVAASLYYTRQVMIPFVLAVFIASVVSPVVDLLVVQLRAPRLVAVSIAMLVVLGIVAVFCLMLVLAVQTVVATVDQYSKDITKMSGELFDALRRWGIDVDKTKIAGEMTGQLRLAVTRTMGTLTGVAANGILILIFAVFLLAGRSTHTPQRGVYA